MKTLEVKNLSLELNGTKILDDVNFQTNDSQWVAIVGPNGSGKTSLVKSLFQMYSNYNGTIAIDGLDLKDVPAKQRGRQLSYVPQLSNDFHESFSVSDLMRLSRFAYEASLFGEMQTDQNKADELLTEFELTDFKHSSLNILSGGEKQRALIAAAIYQDADFIVMDEPTSSLDPGHQEKVIKSLEQVKSFNKGCLLVTHDLNLAKMLCDQILILKRGEQKFYDTTDRLTLEILNEVFEKQFELVQHNNRELILPVSYQC